MEIISEYNSHEGPPNGNFQCLTRVFIIGESRDWEAIGTGNLRIEEVENRFYIVV